MSESSILLPYQQEWLADSSRVRVWEKSRRIGASWVCAFETVLDAIGPGGCSSWYVSYNHEVCQEFIRDVADWAKSCSAAASGIEEGTETDDLGQEFLTYTVRFPTGHRVTALSSKPSNLRNRKGRVIVDEAAHVPDLAETLKAAMAVLMWGGRVDILSTHNGADSAFNQIVTDTKAGRKRHSLHRTTIGDALRDGLFRRICCVLGEEWSVEFQKQWLKELLEDYGDDADEELWCVPKRSGGTYLPRLLIEDRMVDAPVFRFEAPPNFAQRPDVQRAQVLLAWAKSTLAPTMLALPKDLMHSFGEDFGRTADVTVIAPVTVKQDLRRHVPFLVELRDVPFREQELVLNFVVDRLPRFVYGALDATGNGQYMAERAWQRYGEDRIEQVTLTEKWYGENLPPMKAALEDTMLTLPRDADVLTDLLALQVINGIPKLPKIRTTQKAGARRASAKRHGDAAIAVALGHYASRQPVLAYEYNSVRKRSPTPNQTRRAGGFRSRPGGIL